MTQFDELARTLGSLTSVQGISPVDLLGLPKIISQTLGKMVRNQGLDLQEFSADIGLSEAETHQLADILVAKGYLIEEVHEEHQSPRYHTYFARMRSHHLPIDL